MELIRILNFACYSVCIVIVIVYTLENIFNFCENKDLCEVSYRPFHDDESAIYPSLTLCLKTPFLKNVSFPNTGYFHNSSEYEYYLIGSNKTNATFNDVSFEDVSVKLNDFLNDVTISSKEHQRMNKEWKEYVTINTWGLVFGVLKCFTFDVPFQQNVKVSSIKISINNSIFPSSIRPRDGWSNYGMQFFFHLPKQFIRSFSSNKRFWSGKHSSKDTYRLRYSLLEMEILRKRDKQDESCLNNDIMNYDDWMVNYIVKEVKCRPPYWKRLSSNLEYPVCRRYEELQQVTNLFWKFFYGINNTNAPCKEIKKMDISYQESVIDKNVEPNTTLINFYYYNCNEYKEIRQMQAYTGMVLVGNIGGFLGMLLGFALVQIPDLIYNGFYNLKNTFFEIKETKTQSISK